jgi:hypothetical protein
MEIQTISTLAGLFAFALSLFVSLVGAYLLTKRGVGEKTASAQESAISAMQSELSVLRRRAEDEEEKRKRLEHVIDTICEALKTQGIIITVLGEVVNIEVRENKTTAIRIQDK